MQIVSDNNCISLASLYYKEKYIAQKLTEMLSVKPEKPKKIETEGLQEDQIDALRKMVESNLFILTGSPGTGKTFLIKKYIECFKESRIALAAPTGKASKRMMEMTGEKAKTIHKLLEPMLNETGKFEFTRNASLPIPADIVIIDEMSMVSVSLMDSLVTAIGPETRLVMIGDSNQLPAVGPGNLLKDMISSNKIPFTELATIKRQNPGLIIKNCHHIKNGERIEIDNSKGSDFYFLPADTVGEIENTIIELITTRLPSRLGFDPIKDIQILSPYREKTILSCKALNNQLQKILNSNKSIENVRFKDGDKIINTKNNYELEILNGDIGTIQEIDMEEKKIYAKFSFPDREVEIPLYDNDLMLAYAVTVHKFQGSESDVILLPIHKSFGPFLMQRNLLYTAISRAKKLCILIGQREEMPKIIGRNHQQQRYTNLERFLTEGGKDE